jgi:outer membrane immunogenic protein
MRFREYLFAAAAMGGLGCSAAWAQGPSVYYDPQIAPPLTAPSYFEGLYAGVLTGVSSARHDNFFTTGAPLRIDATAVSGWGWAVAPGVIASGEVQASVSTDFLDASDYDVMALGRLGFLSDSRFMTYVIGGVGYFADAPAWEAGMGYEWMASSNLSLRLEGVGIGQLGDVPNGNNVPGISAVRLTTGAVWHFDGQPQGGIAAAGPAGTTDFTGPYAGLYAGSFTNSAYNFFLDYGHGGHLSRVTFGGIGGWNYGLSDSIRIGVEAQAGTSFDSSGDVGVDGVVLARAGYVPVNGLMPYVATGVGVLENKGVYAVGGGVEYALWGHNSLRAEVLGLGDLTGGSGNSGITAEKLTFGTLWHFD